LKRVLVVGSGIAGLIAALELSRGYRVALVTKSELADGSGEFQRSLILEKRVSIPC
jgi:L-aspartate oxidase